MPHLVQRTAKCASGLLFPAPATLILLAAALAPGLAQPQTPSPGSTNRDATEQRRAQERESQLRQQQERAPEVRGPSSAATPPERLSGAQAPCSRINQLELRGEEAGRFGWLLDSVAGPAGDDSPLRKCLGVADLELVRRRAQDALTARGYMTSRVLLQPQDLSSGTLALTLVPGRIHAIRLAQQGSERASLWNTVPARAGDVLNLRDIEQALENFKRVPTAQADIQIEAAEGDGQGEAKGEGMAPGQSDLVIHYSQATPFRLALSADDSGTKATGKYQGAITLSYDNWWTLSDLFYLSLNHDLGGASSSGTGANSNAAGTRGATVHYSVPLGYWLLGGTLSRNQYAQTVAGATQNYVYRGTSRNAELKLSRVAFRDADGKTTVHVKAWQRLSNNYIDDTEVQVQRRVVGGWELGVGHRQFIGAATLEGNLAYRRGTGAFGSIPAPEEALGEGTSRFALATADVAFSAPLKLASQPVRYTAVWRIQSNRTPLTPQDRFAIGGRYTVRGFDSESSLSAERGWLLRNELSTPIGQSGQEFYAGLDHGEVGGPSAALLAGRRLTGAVLGLRGSVSAVSYDIFIGAPLRHPDLFRTANVTAGFNLAVSF
jgi:hemolysin activation/secretion protein